MLSFSDKKLKVRLLSALVAAPLAILMIYLGGFWYAAMVLGCGFTACYEWVQLSLKTKRSFILIPAGLVYITSAMVFIWGLREMSFVISISFFLAVWFSDIFAYFFGKFLKGPKLLPNISPNKTWAGLLGAMIGPVVVLTVGEFIMSDTFEYMPRILLMGCVFGVVCQVGDLIVSSLKRIANVKDSGAVMPGHGGVLDRIDSILLASIVTVLFFIFVFQGHG